jgi:hypothetical protein
MTESARWWQWPTILSLDAPAVAVLWQAALARAAGVELHWAHSAVLGASVWLAYAADRWIEGWRLDWRDIRTERHFFYRQWRWPVAAVFVVVLAADLAVAFTELQWIEIGTGLLLIVPVLLYLLSHQLIHRHSRWRLPKELIVAGLLTGGACVFLVRSAHVADLAAAASLFALLCFTNCALISSWERDVDLSHGQTSLAVDRDGAHQHGWAFPQLPWLVAIVSAFAYAGNDGPSRTVAACALASALLLAVVDRLERRAGWRAARVLADIVLMTPVVPLLWTW